MNAQGEKEEEILGDLLGDLVDSGAIDPEREIRTGFREARTKVSLCDL